MTVVNFGGNGERRYAAELAMDAAQQFQKDIAPFAGQILIAGSLRRGAPTVKDIEIVVEPILIPAQESLFGEQPDLSEKDCTLLKKLDEMVADGSISKYVAPKGSFCWGARFRRAVLDPRFYGIEIPIDIFIVRAPSQWGVQATLRTGNAQFSRTLVKADNFGGMMPKNFYVREGALWRHDGLTEPELIETPTEESFFAAIGRPWIDPTLRSVPLNWEAPKV